MHRRRPGSASSSPPITAICLGTNVRGPDVVPDLSREACPARHRKIGSATGGFAIADGPRPIRERFQPAGPSPRLPRALAARARVDCEDRRGTGDRRPRRAGGADRQRCGRRWPVPDPAQPGADEPARSAAAQSRRLRVLHRTASGSRRRCRAVRGRTGRHRGRGDARRGDGCGRTGGCRLPAACGCRLVPGRAIARSAARLGAAWLESVHRLRGG